MRFDELTEAKMSQEQLLVFERICSGPSGRMGEPIAVLLHSPKVADRIQMLSEYVRFDSVLAGRIMELIILITARNWNCEFVWRAHHHRAIKAGLSAQIAAAIAEGRTPPDMNDDESIAYRFCTELLRDKKVGDDTFIAAANQFGEAGIVDIMAGAACYVLQSMALNVNRQALPAGTPSLLPPLS